MEFLWILLSGICIIIGLMGALLPILPGLPFSYLGILILHFSGVTTFSTTFLVVWAFVIFSIMILENALPAYVTKKFGGSSYGAAGSFVGLILGILLFSPLGFLFGTLAGALIGELIFKQNLQVALKATLGSFIGFLTSTLIKIIVAIIFVVLFFRVLF